jgi:hypothetical protein
MQPHPEGGFFKETYRAKGVIPGLERNHATAIYYLLPRGAVSRLHRLKWDELFHFYLGGPLNLVKIHPGGLVETVRLGHDVESGCVVQHVIPAGTWFGCHPEDGTEFCLIGCTVAPGFDFRDFEIGDRARLLAEFPQARAYIDRLMPA